MSYQVLARKWRPNSFEQVVGQQHVLQALTNALDNNRLHHAYLFTGTRGVGKTSIARLLAKALNCEVGVSSTPCGQCQSCVEIDNGNFIDLIEVDAASKTKVEDTRDILDNVQYKPARGRYKVYLIDEVHMLSRSSFNALLKTLEEPPEHVKFLFATTEAQKLPITILSRCLQFNLKVITASDISVQLRMILNAEKITFDDVSTDLIAKSADGSMRDALSLTDQAIAFGNGVLSQQTVCSMLGTIDSNHSLELLKLAAAGNSEALFEQISNLTEFSPNYDQLLKQMASDTHLAAMAQLVKSVVKSSSDPQRIIGLAKSIKPEVLQLFYHFLINGRQELEFAPDPKTGFEMIMLRLLAFIPQVAMQESSIQANESMIDDQRLLDTLDDQQSNIIEQAQQLTENNNELAQYDRLNIASAMTPESERQEVTPAVNVLAVKQQPAITNSGINDFVSAKNALKQKIPAAQDNPVKKPKAVKQITQAVDVKSTPELTVSSQGINTDSGNQNITDPATLLAPNSDDPWTVMINEMAIGGRLRLLAMQSSYVLNDNKVHLKLRPQHQHLLADAVVEQLEAKISEYLNKKISLEIQIGVDEQLTPDQIAQNLHQQRMSLAQQCIASDSFINEFTQRFDATVINETIKYRSLKTAS